MLPPSNAGSGAPEDHPKAVQQLAFDPLQRRLAGRTGVSEDYHIAGTADTPRNPARLDFDPLRRRQAGRTALGAASCAEQLTAGLSNDRRIDDAAHSSPDPLLPEFDPLRMQEIDSAAAYAASSGEKKSTAGQSIGLETGGTAYSPQHPMQLGFAPQGNDGLAADAASFGEQPEAAVSAKPCIDHIPLDFPLQRLTSAQHLPSGCTRSVQLGRSPLQAGPAAAAAAAPAASCGGQVPPVAGLGRKPRSGVSDESPLDPLMQHLGGIRPSPDPQLGHDPLKKQVAGSFGRQHLPTEAMAELIAEPDIRLGHGSGMGLTAASTPEAQHWKGDFPGQTLSWSPHCYITLQLVF
jgi:hypothetical protein